MDCATWSARRVQNPAYPETPWSLSADRQWLELRAMDPVEAGEEVTICYGEGSRAEVLAVHGYIPCENEADFVRLFESPVELVAAVEQITGCQNSMEPRLSLLQSADNVQAMLAIRPGGLPACSHLLSSLEVVLADEEEFSGFREVWSEGAGHAIFAPSASLPQEKRDDLHKCAVLLAGVLVKEALDQMGPTSMDEEEIQASNSESSDDDSIGENRNRVLAARFRLGVKELLADFLEHVAALDTD